MSDRCDSASDVWGLFLSTHMQVVQKLAQELEQEAGLQLSQFDVLYQLADAPGHRLRQTELVQRLLLSKSGISRRIDRMVEAGLVQRMQCPSDLRGAFVVLTPQGDARFQCALAIHARGIREHFSRYILPNEAESLKSAFIRVLDDGE